MALEVWAAGGYLDGDGKSVVSEGLEAEAARLLGGLPHRQQVPGTLQVKRHSFHHLRDTRHDPAQRDGRTDGWMDGHVRKKNNQSANSSLYCLSVVLKRQQCIFSTLKLQL